MAKLSAAKYTAISWGIITVPTVSYSVYFALTETSKEVKALVAENSSLIKILPDNKLLYFFQPKSTNLLDSTNAKDSSVSEIEKTRAVRKGPYLVKGQTINTIGDYLKANDYKVLNTENNHDDSDWAVVGQRYRFFNKSKYEKIENFEPQYDGFLDLNTWKDLVENKKDYFKTISDGGAITTAIEADIKLGQEIKKKCSDILKLKFYSNVDKYSKQAQQWCTRTYSDSISYIFKKQMEFGCNFWILKSGATKEDALHNIYFLWDNLETKHKDEFPKWKIDALVETINKSWTAQPTRRLRHLYQGIYSACKYSKKFVGLKFVNWDTPKWQLHRWGQKPHKFASAKDVIPNYEY